MSQSFLFENESGGYHPVNPKVTKSEHVQSQTENTTKTTTYQPHQQEEGSCLKQDARVELAIPLNGYQGITVDSKEEGLLHVIAGMEGSPWRVTYYQQYLGQDDEVQGFSERTLAAFQQYRCIEGYEIRVTNPLSYNHDTTEQEGELTGSAHFYPVLKPNKGDVFLADIGDGRIGVFEIDTVRRLSHRRYTAFEVEYHVRDYLNADIHRNLQEKTIDTYRFDYKAMMELNNPFLLTEEWDVLSHIEQWTSRLIKKYFVWFFDTESYSFTVPFHNGHRTYDVGHNKFINAIIDKARYPKYRQQRLQVVDTKDKLNIVTLWDALIEQDWLGIDEASTKFAIISRESLFSVELAFNAYSGVYDYFVYDIHRGEAHQGVSFTPRFSAPAELPLFIEEDTTSNRRYIYHVGINQDYVFSQYFYLEDTCRMSRLELQVYNWLKGQPLCHQEVLRLMEASLRWDDLDRYYLVPILIFLGQMIIGGA